MNHHRLLTDQLERQLIQREISNHIAFRPAINLKRIGNKIVSIFRPGRVEVTLGKTGTAH